MRATPWLILVVLIVLWAITGSAIFGALALAWVALGLWAFSYLVAKGRLR